MLPVSFSPSTFKLNVAGVVSPPRPGTSPDHLPERSAACVPAASSSNMPPIRIVLIVCSFRNGLSAKLLHLLYPRCVRGQSPEDGLRWNPNTMFRRVLINSAPAHARGAETPRAIGALLSEPIPS